MSKLIGILSRVLADNRASILVIFIAVAARCIQLLFYLDSFFDTTFQVIATQNLVAGNGISTAVVKSSDLSAVIFQPLINWPPGYSLLLAPFYIASGQNYLVACFILEVLAAISIILLTRRILFLLEITLSVVNLYTLISSFFIYYFIFKGSTDSIAIAFLLAGVNYTMVAIKTNQRWIQNAILTGICLLLSASLKYLFFPVVFTLPFFLFIYGYQNKSLSAKKAAYVSFTIVAIGIITLYFYQKSISGAGAYISSTGRGFFPDHLLRAHPFIPAAFITPNTVEIIAGDTTVSIMNTFRIFHIPLYISLLIATIVFFCQKGLKNVNLSKAFFFLSFSLTLSITLLLAVLSLVVEKEYIPPNNWWTYIEDPRYYGLTDILVQLTSFLLFFHYRRKARGLFKYIVLILPFLLLPEVFRGLVFTGKRLTSAGKEEFYWKKELEFQRYVASIVRQHQDSLKFKNVVVTSSLSYASYRTSMHQHIPVMGDLNALINPGSLKAKEPVLLLAIFSEKSLPAFQSFINYPGTKLAGQFNRFYFYTLYVTSH